MALAVTEENNLNSRSKIHSMKLALLIGCASIIMMFAGLTSAYIVRRAGGNWLEFRLPNIFFINTVVMLLSSIAIHSAYIFFKRGNETLYKGLLGVSFILGLAFVVLQYKGWLDLTEIGVELTGNPAGSFIYVISGIHAAHVLGGLAAILIAMIQAFALKYKVTKRRKLRFELTLIYWHFVDFLWIYLLVFFLSQQ
ncbi:MAG: cytochrome c oxidase subunit 3 [Bacteroidota bacterium]